MSFLQPWMLFALPLVALPVIIHLINQRRYRTIRWAAMQFLLAANRMSRGYARIRQWLILAARTLAVAGLLFAVSRPLASGWMRLAGGDVDTTIVVLDRSPSMLEQGPNGAISKLESGRDRLVESLKLLGSNRWVLIDGREGEAVEVESPDALASLVSAEGVSASADLPAMLQTAYEYVRDQRPSRTEVWICSDVRRHDWAPGSGRWQATRDAFLSLPQPVRFHLLAFPDIAPANRSVRVTDVRRVESTAGAELLLSLRVEQSAGDGKGTVPITVEVDGARSEIAVAIDGTEAEVKNHAIPLAGQAQGWGRVSIPADANAADNEFFFVYQKPAARKTLVVADDPEAVRPLALAAAVSPDPSVESAVETVAPDQLAAVAWEGVSLVLWQAELPGDDAAERLRFFLGRGGKAVFFPPASPGGGAFAGVRWGSWRETESEKPVTRWTGDQDLLAKTRGGAALPVGDLEVSRYCEVQGDQTTLATLDGGAPLLCRAVVSEGGAAEAGDGNRNAYFCATTTSPADSSLARDGVVLYVMVQRALAAGAAALDTARRFDAGAVPVSSTAEWELLAGSRDAVPSEYPIRAGVYRHGENLYAVNRGEPEDRTATVGDAQVAGLFNRLEFDRVDASAGGGSALLSEVWRLFLAAMIVALLVEAALCLPRKVAPAAGPAASFFPGSPVREAVA